MTTKTLMWVSDVSDTPDSHGNLYVNVKFDDDTVGYKGGKPETIGEHHAALTALLSKEAEFLLEEAGTTAKGAPKFKIVGYPGWEASPPGGGGGKASWYNSREGVEYTQERTDRRTALMQARKYIAEMEGLADPSYHVKVISQDFYTWLRSNLAPTTETATPVNVSQNPGINGQGGATGAGGGTDSLPLRPAPGTSGPAPDDWGAEGQGSSGEGSDPKPPSSQRHDQLWSNLVDFAGGKVKALKLVNDSTNGKFAKAADIPEQVLEDMIRTYALQETK